MAKKNPLDRGLDHLFNQNNMMDEIDERQIIEIDLSEIAPNPYQPRKSFEEESLRELSDSIKEQGVFQPILVRETMIGYEIISGERRFRASKLAGKETIPAIVYKFSDAQSMEVALIENIQREDLSIVEEARSYEVLIKNLGITQNELAQKVGKSRSHITNIIRLLKLDEETLSLVEKNILTLGHVKVLISIEDKKVQKDIVNKIVDEELTVRAAEQLAKAVRDGENPEPAKPKAPRKSSSQYGRLERILREKIDAKVKISGKTNGKITIDYNSVDDLERIVELFISPE